MADLHPLGTRNEYALTFHRIAIPSDSHSDSDVIRLNVLGKNVLIVNTYEAANELFEKRAAIYSDRVCCICFEFVRWK